ncbi:3-alpha,7-alpha,12-alpha-trihydroxy-5-beta-chole st-24-enoyl-CoAhydratase OS=Tsukamurella paurometabola(strain ATCC 8368 / DSM / CCUG 35730 / CIP 100753/ JCM 10117 / KCTC 9821 / NBRC 16120 / NCIMB 702349 / NCTC 13040) OX=521096 GN=Tpau_3852 PE=3 SV=1 [Tsukamurella paurometabola]|uniref:3-alpha,7-alpha,12-alpha-trihydroxy-5-beta-chole st-24-enoyl-CoAhydratase n=1 Tax=Tsukamurella paurometabola (strain ATCC 8368 / DSM 20162 / CCUG 35730 / CIP 100753 / JCM 10117 / KCTC 9821 / NBRC 16120 / NCIMB 702349 / NCTC 13040) TaxID=521096 RepID=D5UMF3_TSUPD|nr:MaoC/PaaZ C-terminal domain-containing protein [Tsukamurella paurometabola]ADG80427.1 3-alpha,7-alpha,12-alpha-trihydroxy-5-beta-chole st-24-enoyl-CoAhydratase [Tsukamurella paurometabola DSM 20162]SUP39600.1 (3R)-hydroxyacyl-ACP dehydratase subunit HadB [Tsukamurella paurometabola]
MPIDPSVAIGADLGTAEFSWNTSDVLLYQLALGAGADPLSARELRYATEKDTVVLPSFATVAQNFHATEPPKVSFPGIEIDLAKVVHGSQSVTAHRPLPTSGRATARTRIIDVHDKGKAAVIWQETEVVDEAGEPLWTSRSSIFARGEGGFGGDRGPSEKIELPDRAADAIVDVPTIGQQALIYRLCGDRNPLHSDPAFAKAAGFDAPILHGLCTYGIVAKAVTDAVLDGDAAKVGSWSAKFAGIMLPGETLRVRIWRADDRHLVTAESVERGAPVLSDAVFTAR